MKPPYFRVVRAFQETYHMRGTVAIHHLILCLSCGHWRRIQTKAHTIDLPGRLFSCKESHA
jgi:hypothetical protein